MKLFHRLEVPVVTILSSWKALGGRARHSWHHSAAPEPQVGICCLDRGCFWERFGHHFGSKKGRTPIFLPVSGVPQDVVLGAQSSHLAAYWGDIWTPFSGSGEQ